MTKTKAQLRAEAVERLRDTDAWLSTSADLINAMLGDRCEVGMANKRRYFIDLLTDEEPPEGDAVSELRLWAETDQSHEDPERVLVERRIMSELADMVERDYVRVDSEDNPGYIRRQRYIDMKAERDELQERVDNLCASEEIGNKLIIAQLETEAEQGRTIVEYAEKVDELEAVNEQLRDKLSRAYDNAHETVTMVDASGEVVS